MRDKREAIEKIIRDMFPGLTEYRDPSEHPIPYTNLSNQPIVHPIDYYVAEMALARLERDVSKEREKLHDMWIIDTDKSLNTTLYDLPEEIIDFLHSVLIEKGVGKDLV